jgi:hypothetical protein
MAPTSIRISSPPRRARFGNYDGLTRSAQDEKEREEMLKCRREKGMSHVCSTSAFLTRSPDERRNSILTAEARCALIRVDLSDHMLFAESFELDMKNDVSFREYMSVVLFLKSGLLYLVMHISYP